MNVAELEAQLLSLLKGQHSSLTISFNDHASNYCDVRQAILDGLYDHADWVSEAEKEKAAETNRAWVIQWYPNTPVGFSAVAASTLQACIDAIS